MIVDPDFPDHWKVRMLVGLLDGDEAAPVYVLRLWAHCQNRRKAEFEGLTSEALKALCRFPGHANKLESSLATSGFIRRSDTVLHVLNWAEYNASLIASWVNGGRGGRKKKPTGSNNGTQHTPTGIPTGTRVEKSSEDKSGEDQKKVEATARGSPGSTPFTPPTLAEVHAYCRERKNRVDPNRFVDFYASKGWMVGKNKMKDWRAAVRNWENDGDNRGAGKTISSGPGQVHPGDDKGW